MLDNLLFSVNTVLPIFAVMLAGFLLRRFGFLPESFFQYGNKLVFYGALPASLFFSVYELDMGHFFDSRFVAFTVLSTFLSFLLLWGITEWTVKDKSVIGTMVQAGYRGNFAILGIPLLHNVIGVENSEKSLLVIGFVLPLYSIFSVVVLTIRSRNPEKIDVKKILLHIVKNPLIISIAAGFLFVLLPFRLPGPAEQTVGLFQTLSTPLALLCLGGSIQVRKADSRFRRSVVSSLIKTMVLPLIFVPAAYFLGFRSYDLTVILIMFGAPTAVASYSMATEMGGDGEIAANAVIFSTFLSVFTLTAYIFLFRALGFI